MNEKENAIRIKAKLEARTEDILNLMASMNMTAQEAVDALRISDDDRTFFLNVLPNLPKYRSHSEASDIDGSSEDTQKSNGDGSGQLNANNSQEYKELIERWGSIKESIRNSYALSDISFLTWIEPLQIKEVSENLVTISVPPDKVMSINYIFNMYYLPIKVSISEAVGRECDIRFVKDS